MHCLISLTIYGQNYRHYFKKYKSSNKESKEFCHRVMKHKIILLNNKYNLKKLKDRK